MINDGSNMKINSDKGDSYRSSKTSPTGKPKKNFEEVIRKEEREERGQEGKKKVAEEDKRVEGKEKFEDVADKLEAQKSAPQKKEVSLFDLAGTKETEEKKVESDPEEISTEEFSEEMQKGSLSALFKGLGSKDKLKAIQEEVHKIPDETPKITEPMQDLLAESTDLGPKVPPPAEKGEARAAFAQEQTDLSGINPVAGTQAAGTSQVASTGNTQQTTPNASRIQEIVDQIVNKLYTVSKSGQTDTLIQLKHPPLFAGANVVITSFNTAKGEFNITFENLTQAAKQLLDLKQNQEALKLALDQKGYTVHIITTTTLSEHLDLIEGRSTERDKGEKDADSQGRGEEKEDEKEQ